MKVCWDDLTFAGGVCNIPAYRAASATKILLTPWRREFRAG